MSSNSLVSIIVIFLNAEQFIQEAIESVFAQTYENWELLLVDDGSTDGSTVIAQQYAQKYPGKVRYVEHEGHQNRGMSATRNLGIRNAKGKYIALLDSDDVWLPQKLEQQVDIMESHPETAMVFGQSLYWESWTGNPDDSNKDYMPELGVEPNTLFKPPTLMTLCYPLGKATAPCPSNLLLRRTIVEQIGGFEEGFTGIYQLYEDQAFLSKLYLIGSVFIASECWERHRIHPNSCVAKVHQSNQYNTVRLFFLNWLEKYLIKQNIQDPKIWNLLRKALWTYQHPQLYKITVIPRLFTKRMIWLLKSIARLTFLTSIHRWQKAQF
ncbi:glycosyltransferase family 2 protein [Nostoc sp. C110]|uniref:glycosyltransferase family 2 protein n=1 Tax=Nostoc sp. C110 TaxID=3349876 RepID=UPI00370DD061